MIQTSPPGGGTPIHRHSREDEVLVVPEAEIKRRFRGIWKAVPAGRRLAASVRVTKPGRPIGPPRDVGQA